MNITAFSKLFRVILIVIIIIYGLGLSLHLFGKYLSKIRGSDVLNVDEILLPACYKLLHSIGSTYRSPNKEISLYYSNDQKQICFETSKTGLSALLPLTSSIHKINRPEFSSNNWAVLNEDYLDVFHDEKGNGIQNIYIVDSQGKLTSVSGKILGLKPRVIPIIGSAGWSPNGDNLIVDVGWEGPPDLYLLKPDGSQFKKIGQGRIERWLDHETFLVKLEPCYIGNDPIKCRTTRFSYNVYTEKKETFQEMVYTNNRKLYYRDPLTNNNIFISNIEPRGEPDDENSYYYAISPNDDKVAYIRFDNDDRPSTIDPHLFIYDVKTNSSKDIYNFSNKKIKYAGKITWSFDEKTVEIFYEEVRSKPEDSPRSITIDINSGKEIN